MKIFLVQKFSDLNGISEEEIDVQQENQEGILNADSIFDGSRVCQIKRKVYNVDGSVILFVETSHSHPIDEEFVEHYFNSRNE